MSHKMIVIGISGASASGKSLLANTLHKDLGSKEVVVIPEDSYYKNNVHLTFEERCRSNYDHPDSFEHNLLCKHLHLFQQGQEVDIPLYDFVKHLRKPETRRVGLHRIVILEGILLFADPELRDLMDIKIFMDTPLDICLLRRVRRDVLERGRSIESVLEQYESTVRPMYLQFIEPMKKYADIIVPRGGGNQIALDMIKAKMRELLL